MPPLVKHSHQHEEGTGGYAVAEHLIDGAFDGLGPEGKNSQHAESQVGDGGVSYQLLQIGLNHGDKCAVDDADDGQDANDGSKLLRCNGEKWQAKSQHAVGPHLQQNSRQNDGTRRGSLNGRIGQPRVERKYWNLDGKSEKESQEEPAFFSLGEDMSKGRG